MAAWRQHPDTFFGVVGQRSTRADTPLEFYDLFFEAFKGMSKEQLLDAMATAPDIEQLAAFDQPRLASIYTERMTHGAFSTQRGSPPPH